MTLARPRYHDRYYEFSRSRRMHRVARYSNTVSRLNCISIASLDRGRTAGEWEINFELVSPRDVQASANYYDPPFQRRGGE